MKCICLNLKDAFSEGSALCFAHQSESTGIWYVTAEIWGVWCMHKREERAKHSLLGLKLRQSFIFLLYAAFSDRNVDCFLYKRISKLVTNHT